MMTVRQLTLVTGLYALLCSLRKRVANLPPEARPSLFELEESIRALGLDPGPTQFPPPEDPHPVATAAKGA